MTTPPIRSARILVANDGSAASENALEWARDVAALDASARVWVLNVLPVPPVVVEKGAGHDAAYAAAFARAQAEARAFLDHAIRMIPTHPVEALVGYGDAADQIATLADAVKADLVILSASTDPGRASAALRVRDRVLRALDASVLVVRTRSPPKVVIAATDGSPQGAPMRLAARIAGARRSDVRLVSARSPGREGAREIVVAADALDAGLIVIRPGETKKKGALHAGVSALTHDVVRQARASVWVHREVPD